MARSAARQGRNAEEFVQEVVSRYFDAESRFIEAVTVGEESLDRGEYVTHDEVRERLARFLRA